MIGFIKKFDLKKKQRKPIFKFTKGIEKKCDNSNLFFLEWQRNTEMCAREQRMEKNSTLRCNLEKEIRKRFCAGVAKQKRRKL